MSTRNRSATVRACWITTLSLTSACTTWKVQSVTPEVLIAAQHPGRIRVTRADRTTIVLRQPELRGDTLSGVIGKPADSADIARHWASVALSDVAQVATRKVDPVATGALALGSATVAAGAVIAIWLGTLPAD
jgi:hypothetical protein